jgi:ribonuclease HI
MELMAAIAALEALTAPSRVILTSDSQYLIKGMTEWLDGWQKKGWKNANKKPVLNRELWARLKELAEHHKIQWVWVRGHTGHDENERCDALAQTALNKWKK